MPGKREIKVLHVGDIDFPIPWGRWYGEIEKISGTKIYREHQLEASCEPKELQKYKMIRVHRSFGHEMFSKISVCTQLISSLEYIDFIYEKNGALWPHLLVKDYIHSLIIDAQPFANSKGSALIIGATDEAILSAHALYEMGLKHITFVTDSPDLGDRVLKTLGAHLFDMKVEVIPVQKVILLSGVYSLLLCFENLATNQELLTALLYFNYLSHNGLIINLGYSLDKTLLLEEAMAINAKVVGLPEVQFHQEMAALRKILRIADVDYRHLRRLMPHL